MKEKIIKELTAIRNEMLEDLNKGDTIGVKFQINNLDTLLYKLSQQQSELKSAEEFIRETYPQYNKINMRLYVYSMEMYSLLDEFIASQPSDEWVSVKCTDCHKITKVLKNENETHFCSYCTHPIWRDLPQPPK